jgi:transposase-like protein
MGRRKYSDEFKREAVALTLAPGVSLDGKERECETGKPLWHVMAGFP